jgi:hypothetical protein
MVRRAWWQARWAGFEQLAAASVPRSKDNPTPSCRQSNPVKGVAKKNHPEMRGRWSYQKARLKNFLFFVQSATRLAFLKAFPREL